MRRTVLIACCLLAATTSAACGRRAQHSAPGPPPRTTTAAPATAPPRPQPATVATCPYLATRTVADANGQRVTAVKVSAGDPPACFFYTYHGELQMSVWIYRGERRVAGAIIDRAAPVASSSKATRPAGWTGGSAVTGSGAVYAVLSGGDAVVVRTNQKQTVKAREIATDTIRALGL